MRSRRLLWVVDDHSTRHHERGITMSATVRINPETHAKLKAICDQIILDETPHVQFQCERLAILRSKRTRLFRSLTRFAQRFLFFGTCFVVWQKHHSVFQRSRSRFRHFWVTAWLCFGVAEVIMNGSPQPRKRNGLAKRFIRSRR